MVENCSILRNLLFKGPKMDLGLMHSLLLGSNTGAAAERAPMAYRKKLKCLALG